MRCTKGHAGYESRHDQKLLHSSSVPPSPHPPSKDASRDRERGAISEPESTVKAHVEQARAAFTRLRCKLKLKWMPSKRHCLGKIRKKNKKNEIALTRVDRLRPASYVCSSSLGTTSVEFYLTFCPVLNFERW